MFNNLKKFNIGCMIIMTFFLVSACEEGSDNDDNDDNEACLIVPACDDVSDDNDDGSSNGVGDDDDGDNSSDIGGIGDLIVDISNTLSIGEISISSFKSGLVAGRPTFNSRRPHTFTLPSNSVSFALTVYGENSDDGENPNFVTFSSLITPDGTDLLSASTVSEYISLPITRES